MSHGGRTFDDLWPSLAAAAACVLDLQTSTDIRGMQLIEDVYTLCCQSTPTRADAVYVNLRKTVCAHVRRMRVERVLDGREYCAGRSFDETALLVSYVRAWDTFSVGLEYLHALFGHLRGWIRRRLDSGRGRFTTTGIGAVGGSGAMARLGGVRLSDRFARASMRGETVQPHRQALSDQEIGEVFEVRVMCLRAWNEEMLGPLQDRLMETVVRELSIERNSGIMSVYSTMIKRLAHSFVTVGEAMSRVHPLALYQANFHEPYVAAVRDFYSREAAVYFDSTNDVAGFMVLAASRISEESERVLKCCHGSSRSAVSLVVDNVWIHAHASRLHAACVDYFANNRIEDLRRMYLLLHRVKKSFEGNDALQPMLDALRLHLSKSASDRLSAFSLSARSDPNEYIEAIIAHWQQSTSIVAGIADNDPAFLEISDMVMTQVVNSNDLARDIARATGIDILSVTSEMLAKFADTLLRNRTNRPNLDEDRSAVSFLDSHLSVILQIFKFIGDKDVFNKFYARLLARRLLQGSSADNDAETAMIAGLRELCGFSYTRHLQRMFTDMNVSDDVLEKFRAWKDNNTSKNEQSLTPGKELIVRTLTTGSWPLQTIQTGSSAEAVSFRVPQELELPIQQFEEFYADTFSSRRLTWLHHLGRGELKGIAFRKPYLFSCTYVQMSVLLAFNHGQSEHLTVEELEELVGHVGGELRQALDSLWLSRVVVCDSRGKPPVAAKAKTVQPFDWTPDVRVGLNLQFSSKRVKVPLLPLMRKVPGLELEQRRESELVRASVATERKLFVQAAIVRIMKARKHLPEQQLIAEAIAQVGARFAPDVSLVMNSVEQLIEKQYLRRTASGNFEYLP